MKHPLLLLTAVLINATATFGQASSVNGNFTATTPSNLSLQTGATPTTRLTILNSNGNIGINTTAPSDWLHVNGNVRANQFNTVNGVFNTTAAATNMSFNTNGTNRMTLLAASGNFGIGTATPADLLHVNGLARATQFNSTLGNFYTVGATNLSLGTNGAAQMTLLNANGNFGIGTATPGGKLHVNGSTYIANENGGIPYAVSLGGSGGEYGSVGFGYKYVSAGGHTFVGSDYASQLNFESGGFNFRGSGTTGTAGGTVNFTSLMKVIANGNVGIGTQTPAYKLDVNGTIGATSLQVKGGAYVANETGAPRIAIGGPGGEYGSIGFGFNYVNGGGATYSIADWASKLTFDTGGFSFGSAGVGNVGSPVSFNPLMKVLNNGNVGIGTVAPTGKLHIVHGGTSNGTNPAIQIESTTAANFGATVFKNDYGDEGMVGITGSAYSNGIRGARATILTNNTPGGIVVNSDNPNASIVFGTGGSAVANERMRIYNNGNVGIGTATPAYKLDVAGTINATSILVNGAPISGGASQWLTNGTAINYPTGNVSIGSTPINSTGLFQLNYSANAGFSGALIKNSNGGNVSYAELTMYNDIDKFGQLFFTGSNYSAHPAIKPNAAGILSVGSGGISFLAGDVAAPITFGTSNINRMIIDPVGNVGIGTATPNAAYKLDVAGTINATSILVNGAPISGGTASQWATNGSNISYATGNVGIGTTSPNQKLTVNGTIYGKEVKVDLAVPGPDYVFEKEYDLMSLEDTKAYIDANKHLPEVPSAKEMEKNGVQLGEMNMLLLKKVEELTLYSIEQNKKLNEQQELIQGLIKEMQQLKTKN
jgi:hypothetical protein